MALEVKSITKNNIRTFSSLFDPQVADAIAGGAPITALGVFSEGVGFGGISGTLSEDHIFDVSSLYVAPSYRRRGGGTLLIDSLNDLLIPFDARVEIRYNESAREQEILTEFLLINGYEFDASIDAPYYMTTLGELAGPEFMNRKSKKGSGDISSFRDLASYQLNKASERAQKIGAPLPAGGLNGPAVDLDLSMALVTDEKIRAYVAVEKVSDTLLDVAAIYGGSGGPVGAAALVRKALQAAVNKYSPDIRVSACAVSEESERLVDKMFDGKLISRKLYKRAEPLFNEIEIDRFVQRVEEGEENGIVRFGGVPLDENADPDSGMEEYLEAEEDLGDPYEGITYEPGEFEDDNAPIYLGVEPPEADEDDIADW